MAVLRRVAALKDQNTLCAPCGNYLKRKEIIFWTLLGKPIHSQCKNKYYAALVRYYNLDIPQLMNDLGISRRTSYRIMKISRN